MGDRFKAGIGFSQLPTCTLVRALWPWGHPHPTLLSVHITMSVEQLVVQSMTYTPRPMARSLAL